MNIFIEYKWAFSVVFLIFAFCFYYYSEKSQVKIYKILSRIYLIVTGIFIAGCILLEILPYLKPYMKP